MSHDIDVEPYSLTHEGLTTRGQGPESLGTNIQHSERPNLISDDEMSPDESDSECSDDCVVDIGNIE